MTDREELVQKFEGIGPNKKEKPRIEHYREKEGDGVDIPEEAKNIKSQELAEVSRDIAVNIVEYSGSLPQYNNWTIEAEAWLKGEGPEMKERMRIGIVKDTGNLKESDVVEKAKKKYRKLLANKTEHDSGSTNKDFSKSERVLEDLKSREAK